MKNSSLKTLSSRLISNDKEKKTLSYAKNLAEISQYFVTLTDRASFTDLSHVFLSVATNLICNFNVG